jgi:tetratricopeptide (TPR) repeat protein
MAMARAGRYGDMEAKALELTASHPSSGLAWKALSVALQMQGKDALQPLERAARLLPGDAEAQSNLGAALRRLGRLDEAVACLRRALQLRPDLAQVWNNLGNAERDLGRPAAALEAFGHALRLKPDLAKAHNNRGNALHDLGRLDDAVAAYRRAIEIDAKYAEAHRNLGIVLRLQGRAHEAESCCRQALAIAPDDPAAAILLAHLSSDRGEFAQARTLLERAIAVDPNCAEAWAGLADLGRMTRDDAGWLAGALRIAERALPRDAVHLRFAIGKYCDDVGDYDEAFRNYRCANQLAKTLHPAHDRRRLTAAVDQLIESFSAEWLGSAQAASNGSERPVFVVGMPRSGTTLAEQILASHPQVHGAGELPYWNTAAGRYAASARAATDSDAGADSRDAAGLPQLAEDYLALLRGLSPDALRVVDKMPANFLYLGLIRAALPNARIIHLQRNPIDTCLSIYFQNFGAVHSYANDLEDLAHYFREYRRLMDHWRRSLPAGAILEVPYEKLVESPEVWSRRMIEFVGLPWDARCLDFGRTARVVSTFSKWQARQPIHRASVERWRHYERYVGPLRSLLDPAAPA